MGVYNLKFKLSDGLYVEIIMTFLSHPPILILN